jgi:hypothetical protein
MEIVANPKRRAAQILRRASVILLERGWTQGATLDPKSGSVDVLGAIALAAGVKVKCLLDDDVLATIPRAIMPGALLAIEALDAHLGQYPVTWNDAAGRQIEQVRQAADRVADLLSAGEGFG